MLDTIAENVARLCEASDALLVRVDGNNVVPVASFGTLIPDHGIPLSRGSPAGRAILDQQMLHVRDLAVEVETEFPEVADFQKRLGHRTMLATPMVREGKSVGAILIRRLEVRPFTDNQVSLLKNFADQAVIAIENVRLFQESQSRNRDLTEALEQQTATSEILGVIASSPTDLQPVLDVVAENAARLCDADDALILRVEANVLRLVASYGPLPTSQTRPINREFITVAPSSTGKRFMSMTSPRPKTNFRSPGLGNAKGIRTFLATPLLRKGVPIGAIAIRRTEVRPFSEKQIELLKTFADQAVIAIENVRLFQELTEALEQQTATNEILSVIASSPTDIQPVLNAVTENAARLCDATDAQIRLVDGNMVQHVAAYGPMRATPSRVISRGFTGGRAIVDRRTIHIHDLEAVREVEYPETPIHGYRTVLAVPLLRKDTPIGVINIRRLEVRPFSDKQIKLLETFAAQAVIAIENVRLFRELGERNAELREALEHQTATAEVLGIINRSPTDVQPVLDAIVESAARVCGIDDVGLRLHENNSDFAGSFWFHAYPDRVEISIDELQVRWIREHGTLHIPDVRAQNDFPTLGRGRRAGAPSWSFPFVSRGNSLDTGRTSYRGAPLHSGADQAA